MSFPRLLFITGCFATSVAFAQYEDLLKQPEPKPASHVVAAPQPRLLAPTLHKGRITHLDQSADDQYLLTGDTKTVRIWDVANRAPIAEFNAPGVAIIEYACFTSTPRQVLIFADQKVQLFENFKLDRPTRQTLHPSSTDGLAYHAPTNTFITVFFDPGKKTLDFAQIDPTAKTREKRFSIPVHPAYERGTAFTGYRSNTFAIDASGRYATFCFANQLPAAVLDLESQTVVTTLPQSSGVVGMLPSGEVLTQRVVDEKNSFGAINPLSGRTRDLFAIPFPRHLSATLPRRPTDPLLLVGSPSYFVHDFVTGQTSVPFDWSGRSVDAVMTFREDTITRPLVSRSSNVGFDSTAAATYLDVMDPVRGVYRGEWSPAAYAATAIYPRSDDFEFIVRRGADLRRVRFTESALQIEPLQAPQTQRFTAAAFYDQKSTSWRLIGAGVPSLATPTEPAGTFKSRPVGIDGRKIAEPNLWTTFNRTFTTDRSRDGRFIALHHGNAVQVIDTSTGRAVAVFFERDATTRYDVGPPPGLALSPDGTTVIFAYRIGQEYVTACHDVASGELKWKTDNVYRDLKFNSDGSRIFGRSPHSNSTWNVLYTDTGERAATFSDLFALPGLVTYNAAGTLLAAVHAQSNGGATLQCFTLPDGKIVSHVNLASMPTSLSFVGSDRFLLVNAANDEAIRLIDTQGREVVAEIYLFESPQKWLVRHPATGLFSSEASVQDALHFAVGDQITPLASYFDEFYRPRLLGSLIKGLAPRSSVPVSDLRYAPKLTLRVDGPSTRGLTVEDEFETLEIPTPEVTLKLDASCEGSPIADLRIYHNGKLVAGATRGLFVEDDEDAPPSETFTKTATHTFTLTPGKNRFRAVAINEQGTESAPDELVVYSDASPPVDDTAGIALHVVTVGINTYQNPAYNLNYARADAEAVEGVLRTRFGSLFTRANHYTLYDAEATRENILATLDTVKREAGPRDVFVFYYAGHGVMSEGDADPEFYLAPYEITQLYGEQRILQQAGIPGRELLAYSRDIAAQKQLFILDACQSAGALKNVAVRGAVEERAIAQLARSTGTHWLTATGSEQFAAEFAKLGHGAFTAVLLNALNGAADTGDGIVSVNELKAYVEAKVPELTAAEKGEAQYPVTYGYGQDFPLTINASNHP